MYSLTGLLMPLRCALCDDTPLTFILLSLRLLLTFSLSLFSLVLGFLSVFEGKSFLIHQYTTVQDCAHRNCPAIDAPYFAGKRNWYEQVEFHSSVGDASLPSEDQKQQHFLGFSSQGNCIHFVCW